MIPLAKPEILESDVQNVVDVLESGMLVQGKCVALAERKIAHLIGGKHVSMFSNGTSTMHTALVSLGIKEGDEVIVPALSYVATANVVELVGATCVFVDVEKDSFNIDPLKIEEKITVKTKAIIPVHEFGLAANMDAIMDIAEKHKLFVIEDAACALGAKYKNKFVGTFGDFASFSFHPRKSITSGEGGCLVSRNSERVEAVNVLKNHGISFTGGKMDFVEAGFNYRLTDIQASLLHGQIDRVMSIIEAKRQIASQYINRIKNDELILPSETENALHTWQSFHLLVSSQRKREQLKLFLLENGIQSNYGAQCIPAMTYYLKKYQIDSKLECPNALNAFECGLVIPLYPSLNSEDIEHIINTINAFT